MNYTRNKILHSLRVTTILVMLAQAFMGFAQSFSQKADSLWSIATSCEKQHKFNDASSYYLESSELYFQERNYMAYSRCLYKAGVCMYNIDQIAQSVETLEHCYDVLEKNLSSREKQDIDDVLNIYLCRAYSELDNITPAQYERGLSHFKKFVKENRTTFLLSNDEKSGLELYIDICSRACIFCFAYQRWVDCINFSELGLESLSNARKYNIIDEKKETADWLWYFGSFIYHDILSSFYLGSYDKLKLYQQLYLDFNLFTILDYKFELPHYTSSDELIKFTLLSINFYHYFGDFDKELALLSKVNEVLADHSELCKSEILDIIHYYNTRLLFNDNPQEYLVQELKIDSSFLGENVECVNLISKYYIKRNDFISAYKYIELLPKDYLKSVAGSSLEQDYYINKCICELQLGDKQKAVESITRYNDMVLRQIQQNTPSLVSINKEQYLENLSRWFSYALPLFVNYCNDEDILRLCYNATLIYKNALLENNVNIIKFAHNSQDPTVIHNLNEYKRLQNLFSNTFEHTSLSRSSLDISLLFSWFDVNAAERKALDLLNYYDVQATDFMDISFEDILKSIDHSEIAIEFFHSLGNDDKITYYALIANASMTSPLCIQLCKEDELINLDINSSIQKTYDLIWKPILNEIKHLDISKIYFAADGLLHVLPIEYSILPSGNYLYTMFDCVRLSSTRKIIDVKKNRNSLPKVAYIFGGINFDASYSDITSNLYKFQFEKPNAILSIDDVTSVESEYDGGALVYYTWHNFDQDINEIKNISKCLKNNKIQVSVFNGSLASEDLIKKVSFNGVNILHFSTHGIYVSASDKKVFPYIDFIDNSNNPMYRSALVCAGINNVVKSGRKHKDICDGLLLSYDIANLNLNDVDLVVLSTCDSGLGEITSDGVWGMQRAFKQAGCKSILMSLSPVEEEPTRYFMENFYRNLFQYGSKIEALKHTQEFLRESKDFREPNNWASFILIDAI